jgi:hypothetical protein
MLMDAAIPGDTNVTKKEAEKIRGEETQLYATQWFIVLVIGCTCFGHLYAHRQELETTLML